MSKPRIQAINTSVAEPTARAMSLATRKTPVPMVSPITMAIADPRPRPRSKSLRSEWSDELFVNIAEVRAYYRPSRWSTTRQGLPEPLGLSFRCGRDARSIDRDR
jgi:hypothetical protein